MTGARVHTRGGLHVELGGRTFALDPNRPVHSQNVFFSHAHMDHLSVPHKSSRVISSVETRLLAAARGCELGEAQERPDGVRLLDSGHILGARSLYVQDEFMYTGDAAGRERAFLKRCTVRRARVLVTETTFGSVGYVFPPTQEVVKQVNALIGEVFDKGRPVVLMGYPLGKAQVLTHLFSSWTPMYFHEDVFEINEVYRMCGVPLTNGRAVNSATAGDLPHGPWVLIAPMLGARHGMISALKKRQGAVTIAFSGWALRGGYRVMLGVDHAFPLSDHCDYAELKKLVRDASPETVYTTHGFADEFAADLRKEGFDARPLNGYQSSISDF